VDDTTSEESSNDELYRINRNWREKTNNKPRKNKQKLNINA
jgi:hypothetical protein